MELARVVRWIGDINQQNFDRVLGEIISHLKESQSDPIWLLLLSDGGETDVGFSFYDNMRLLKPNLITVGTGTVRSIAPVILASGTMRLITENTSFLFHDFFAIDMDAEGRLDSKLLISFGKDLERGMKIYREILVKRSGGRLSQQKIRSIMSNQRTLIASEAVRLGLADAIADPSMFKTE